jgi:hypothetical protein
MYVAVTVPFYAGFEIDHEPAVDFMWYVELLVDIYFIAVRPLRLRAVSHHHEGRAVRGPYERIGRS